MRVELRSDHPGGAALAGRVRAMARAHLAALERPEAELSVLLTGDRALRTLNRRWRGADRATDVLSFPLHDPPGESDELGDVAISIDTARRRARREGRPVLAEVNRYLVHGILHLLGHDHERPEDARAMAVLEERVLGRSGLVSSALPARAPRRSGRGRKDG
ncbi:MAG TPA: rRNA maturation RNase YbeY [Anaeromyxobacteraceae bacterium]|nr:rRNA maturation RNase YbeY [Anaeromyxobacteraceae bacterium]